MPAAANREGLYFFWDYDLTEADLRAILAGHNEAEIAWVISRLLEAARWDDIWKYARLSQVREWFPRLKLRPQTRLFGSTLWQSGVKWMPVVRQMNCYAVLNPLNREL